MSIDIQSTYAVMIRVVLVTSISVLIGACSSSDETDVSASNNTDQNASNTSGGDTNSEGTSTQTGTGDTGSDVNDDGSTENAGNDVGDDSNNVDTNSRTLALSLNGATGSNLVDMSGPWTTFTGDASGITFSAASQLITVPAQTSGFHKFTAALAAGSEHSLAVNSQNPDFAAVLYLADQYGKVLQFTDLTTGATNDWIAARPMNPLRFRAPLNVASYYILIQDKFDIVSADGTLTDINVANNSPTPDLPKTAAGDYLPTGFESLIFSEEFAGSSLNRAKWCTRLPYGSGPALQLPDDECTRWIGQGTLDYANEEENQRFRDINKLGEPLHIVSDGTIKLRATQTDLSRQYQNFEAAALRSKMKFPADPDVKYYFTSRVKMPNVRGSWPAFYLNPDLDPNGIGTTPPEIDILEGALNEVEDTKFHVTQHSQVNGAQTVTGQPDFTFTASNFNPDFGSWRSPVTLRARWVQVGIEWDRKGVCYYVDGFRTACENYRWVTAEGVAGNPAAIIAYLAVGGASWAGRHGIDEAAFPIDFEIDYIRVYSKPYLAD